MKTKEEYIAEAKHQLDEWEAELVELRAKAADAADDVKDKVDHQIAELKAKWEEGAARRQEILDAADDNWEDIKDEAEEKWAEIKVGASHAIDRIKAMFS
jgi:ribosomal protein L29